MQIYLVWQPRANHYGVRHGNIALLLASDKQVNEHFCWCYYYF
jgi:hypothetical protein